MKFLGRKYSNMEEKEKILNGLDKYEKNFLVFLNEVYSEENTQRSMYAIFNKNILPLERELEKDLMHFSIVEIEGVISSCLFSGSSYKATMFTLISQYLNYNVELGNIQLNQAQGLKSSELSKDNKRSLVNKLYSPSRFMELINTIETKSNGLSTIVLVLARCGLGIKQILDLREEDLDFAKNKIYLVDRENNSINYGVVLGEIPVPREYMFLIQSKLNEVEFESSRGIAKFLESDYVVKRTSFAETGGEKENINSVYNRISFNSEQAGIPRVSLNALNKSRRVDLMLEVRKKKLLRISDLEKIFLMFKPNAKTTASGIRSLKNTWEALSGEKVLKARDSLEEYIEPVGNIIKEIEWY